MKYTLFGVDETFRSFEAEDDQAAKERAVEYFMKNIVPEQSKYYLTLYNDTYPDLDKVYEITLQNKSPPDWRVTDIQELDTI